MTDNDFVLQDLHAKYHDEYGNLLGRKECGWDACDFWDAAKFVFTESTPAPLKLDWDDALRIGAEGAALEWRRRKSEEIAATAEDHAYALVEAAFDAVRDAAYDTDPVVFLSTAPQKESADA